jgi:hypothetical protein
LHEAFSGVGQRVFDVSLHTLGEMGKQFSRYSTTGETFNNPPAEHHVRDIPMPAVIALPSLHAIHKRVHEVLCSHDNLDPAHTPLFHCVITRQGKPCGSFFHIQGPRLLKTYAVWAGDENRILFYDSKGERFSEITLSGSRKPIKLAA